jgi:predicted ATPase/DNA-binding winged helix-turn-helix (wHTH) protein
VHDRAEPVSSPACPLRFGPFVLYPARMLLEEHGTPVRLGSRAFKLLVALVERAGETVTHHELVASVWPTTVVEDTNLRVHIGALRRALRDGEGGARYITNVPGRGYSFVMPVAQVAEGRDPALPPSDARLAGDAHTHNLPVRLTRPIGRAGIVADLAARLEHRRLVSIVGPGGMGKTTVAVAVAEQRLQAYEHGARFVDLSPLSKGELVPVALGLALGIDVPREDPWPGLQAFLRDSHMLIVLDNCEHVIEAAAALAEFILRSAARVHILATSREALAAEGEWTHRLPALDLPDPSQDLDRDQALAFPAIELFIERASARSDAFQLAADDLPSLRRLCRRLDGMPLAIELAAGRVDGLGLQAVAARLDDVFRLLTHGRRTALPRHQTLHALLTWSHDLLTSEERMVLRRLSTFRATFTMRCAAHVAASDDLTPEAVEDCVTSLVSKSLVAVEPDAGRVRFRLLYTTRDYAAAKLAEAGEHERWARRHASYFAEWLRLAFDDMDSMSTANWLASQRRVVDDVRAALAWAFSELGDLETGIALAIRSVDFMLPGVHEPYVPQLERALERVLSTVPRRPPLELQLSRALCFTKGTSGLASERDIELVDTLNQALELADPVASRRDIIYALYSLCTRAMGSGDYPTLDATTVRIKSFACDPSGHVAVLLADRYRAMSQHHLGDQREARRLAEAVRDHPVSHPHRHVVGQVPHTVSMRGLLARIHWLRGESDQAVQLAQEVLSLSRDEHPFVLSQTLAMVVVPIALWRGEWAHAETEIERLMAHATRYSQVHWQSWANSYRFILHLHAGVEDRQTFLERWVWPVNPMVLDIIGTFDEDLVSSLALSRVASGTVGWCAAELLRAQAVVQWRRDAQGAVTEVEGLLKRSLHVAREQETLAWELRTVTSLARLWRDQDRRGEAVALLEPVLERCFEGQGTLDVVTAKGVLESLR